MKLAKFLLTVVLLVSSGIALAAKPIEKLIDVPVPTNTDGSSRSIEEVRGAIMSGCQKKRWNPVLDEHNNITCSILVRSKHFAMVEIPYTADKYSIIYRDSRELDYNAKWQRIHRNYNKWVINLSDSIQRQFAITD